MTRDAADTVTVRNAPERSGFPSGTGASGSIHSPWALLRILHTISKGKRCRRQGRPARRSRRPRARRCLLNGCPHRFRPEHARQRYCSPQCREAAREWLGWKARWVYRATAAGKQKRNRQSQPYRKRVKEREPAEKEPVPEAARVITRKFFRRLLRPARLLRMLCAPAAVTAAAVLLACLPACHGVRFGARAALAKKACLAPSPSGKAAPCAAAVKAKK